MCPPGVDIDDDHADKASPLASISAEMVRLYKEQFGRGPTKVRSNWSGRDMIVVLLEDTLTAAERNLVTLGEFQRLRDTRMLFQYSWVAQFCEPVERLTGRKVRAFISGIDAEAEGASLEVFVLHPEGYDGPSRAELRRAA
jgi:uncharacterized protein YbcI